VIAGDPIPDFALEPLVGGRLSSGDLVGRPAVIVFVGDDPLTTDRYLTRIDDTFDRLGGDAVHFRRLAVLLPGRTIAAWERDGWTGLTADDETVNELARRFGVTHWDAAIPAQSFTVTVIDPIGRVERRFGGLDMWTEMDLVTALDGALVNPGQ
jgi:hypothetical protein